MSGTDDYAIGFTRRFELLALFFMMRLLRAVMFTSVWILHATPRIEPRFELLELGHACEQRPCLTVLQANNRLAARDPGFKCRYPFDDLIVEARWSFPAPSKRRGSCETRT